MVIFAAVSAWMAVAAPDVAHKSIAVLKTDVGGDLDPAVSAHVTARLAEALRSHTQARVISADEVLAVLDNEKQRNILGACTDEACLAELANALGADIVATGQLVRIDGALALTVSLVDGKNASVVARTSESWGGDSVQLLALIDPMVTRVFDDAARGAIRVQGAVPGSQVFVDGQLVGVVPLRPIEARTLGGHRVTVLHDDKAPFEAWVVVHKDQTADMLVVQATPEAPFYASWWFWTGGAAAAGVLGAAAASTGALFYLSSQKTGVNVSVNADDAVAGKR